MPRERCATSSIHSVTASAVLARELPREPPADAGVAEVVDDAAEDVPARGEAGMGGRRRIGGHYRAALAAGHAAPEAS